MKATSLLPTDSETAVVDQRILQAFRQSEGGVVSGEALSSLLGISRTAVWKHIKALRDAGYRITSLPSRGYRLDGVSDTLLPAEIVDGLGTRRIGTRVICFAETDSTNDKAFRLAEEGYEEGTVVLAEAQEKGKGRMGRRWESPAGVNLYCSVILRPPIPPMQAAQLTLCSALAVARSIEDVTGLRPVIKWPNDILLNECKVAGLLNEMSAETEKVNFIILGIGININMTREQFPDALRHPATSLLLETGDSVDRRALTRRLLQSLDELYDQFLRQGYRPVREEWLARSNVMNRTVRVDMHDRSLTGVVTGIDDYGALILRRPDGQEEKILAGDVTLLSS